MFTITYNGRPVGTESENRTNSAIDVEATFSAFVRSHGGEVLADSLGPSPSFANADYLFRQQGVVAELKRLVGDKSEDLGIRAKISGLFHRWMNERRIGPIYGTVQIQSKMLPVDCQRDLLAVYQPPLRRRILKANRQIRETTENLNLSGQKGLLILVNDGNYALEADAVLYLVWRILGRQCSGIDSVVYFTVNMLATSPQTVKPVLVWVHAIRPGIASVDAKFVNELFAGWRAFLARKLNQPVDLIELKDPTALAQVRYQRRR